jgi:hypothetical protein
MNHFEPLCLSFYQGKLVHFYENSKQKLVAYVQDLGDKKRRFNKYTEAQIIFVGEKEDLCFETLTLDHKRKLLQNGTIEIQKIRAHNMYLRALECPPVISKIIKMKQASGFDQVWFNRKDQPKPKPRGSLCL